MNKYLRIQLSVLIGMLFFFLGGIINFKKEIIDIILAASIGWAIGFFFTFFILTFLFNENKIKLEEKKSEKLKKSNKKGKNIDIIISDDFDEIYNLKR